MMEQVLGKNVNFVVAFYKNVYIYIQYINISITMYINYGIHNCNIKSTKLKILLIKHINKIIINKKKNEIQHNYDHTGK